MSQQPENVPDQGVEKTLEDKTKRRKRDDSSETDYRRKKRDKKEDRRERGEEAPLPPRYCLVCGKKHEPRCELTPGLRKELRAKRRPTRIRRRQRNKRPRTSTRSVESRDSAHPGFTRQSREMGRERRPMAAAKSFACVHLGIC